MTEIKIKIKITYTHILPFQNYPEDLKMKSYQQTDNSVYNCNCCLYIILLISRCPPPALCTDVRDLVQEVTHLFLAVVPPIITSVFVVVLTTVVSCIEMKYNYKK